MLVKRHHGYVSRMTLDDMARLRALVQARVDDEGQAPFAERIGVGIGVVRSLLGERDIKASNLDRLCAAVGLDVVLRDRAESLMPTKGSGQAPEDYMIVPHLSAKVSAGKGKLVDSEAIEGGTAFARSWFSRHSISPENAVIVQARGDSMLPTIADGAWVVVDGGARGVERKGIYCFRRGDELFVKRIIPASHSPGGRVASLLIVADNPAHDAEVIAGQGLLDIVIVGRAVAALTDL